jgi:predicted DNA-binding transcriptional regulator AlpA
MQAVSILEPSETTPDRLHPVIPRRLLSLEDVSEICGVPINTVRMWRRAGTFPEPIILGGGNRLQRWEPHVISAWLQGKGATLPTTPTTGKAGDDGAA